ncbi:hypothetical protein Fot_55501 [Forsythia ovata]|uniref:Uncharacterized protein n=1 Tax=Forsythia ovata TaxID=205694 RepID=A0ABD1P4C0_9LAMI
MAKLRGGETSKVSNGFQEGIKSTQFHKISNISDKKNSFKDEPQPTVKQIPPEDHKFTAEQSVSKEQPNRRPEASSCSINFSVCRGSRAVSSDRVLLPCTIRASSG